MKTGSRGEYFNLGGIKFWELRRLHGEKLHSLYRSLIVREIRFTRLRWAGYVARMEERSHIPEAEIFLRKPVS